MGASYMPGLQAFVLSNNHPENKAELACLKANASVSIV
jgi:hypothetical protein